LIVVLCFLQVNSIRGLGQSDTISTASIKWQCNPKCWNGEETCNPKQECFDNTVNWSKCVCPGGDKSCLNYFGENREDYISCLPSLNESCGPDSTTDFRTCQPPFRCGLLKNQNKYQCLCDGCNRNSSSLSRNIVTESIAVFITWLKLDAQCGGRDYRGKTECEPTHKCITYSPFWSACKCPDRTSWCPGAPGYPTTTIMPLTTTQTQQSACNFCGVFDTFADVCQNCIFTRDHCLLNCTCRTASGVAQPISFSLSSFKNQGCLIAMEYGRPVCKGIPPDCRHNYQPSGKLFYYGYAN
jgi:hypothetical protein